MTRIVFYSEGCGRPIQNEMARRRARGGERRRRGGEMSRITPHAASVAPAAPKAEKDDETVYDLAKVRNKLCGNEVIGSVHLTHGREGEYE